MRGSCYRLTGLIVLGYLTIIVALLCGRLRAVQTSLPLLVLCFCLALGGVICAYRSAFLFRVGILSDLWSEKEVAPLRFVFDHRIVKWALVLGSIAFLAALLTKRHYSSWYWVTFCVIQTQTLVTGAFSKPRNSKDTGNFLDWPGVSPLRSQRWGER